VQRKCNFHIVFLNEHAELCIPRGTKPTDRAKYLLARSVIQRHLRVNLAESHPALAIHCFQSVQDAAFQNYLSNTGVYFVMCHDGANPVPLMADLDHEAKDNSEHSGIEAQETSRKIKFRAMISILIQKGYNVALINGLDWQDTKVRATRFDEVCR